MKHPNKLLDVFYFGCLLAWLYAAYRVLTWTLHH